MSNVKTKSKTGTEYDLSIEDGRLVMAGRYYREEIPIDDVISALRAAGYMVAFPTQFSSFTILNGVASIRSGDSGILIPLPKLRAAISEYDAASSPETQGVCTVPDEHRVWLARAMDADDGMGWEDLIECVRALRLHQKTSHGNVSADAENARKTQAELEKRHAELEKRHAELAAALGKPEYTGWPDLAEAVREVRRIAEESSKRADELEAEIRTLERSQKELEARRAELSDISEAMSPLHRNGETLVGTVRRVAGSFGEIFKELKEYRDTYNDLYDRLRRALVPSGEETLVQAAFRVRLESEQSMASAIDARHEANAARIVAVDLRDRVTELVRDSSEKKNELLSLKKQMEEQTKELAALSRKAGAKVRPVLIQFAERMEEKLRKHDGDRKGWYLSTLESLVTALKGELKELGGAILVAREGARARGVTIAQLSAVCDEAADVANYAMMIFDNAKTGTLVSPSPNELEVLKDLTD